MSSHDFRTGAAPAKAPARQSSTRPSRQKNRPRIAGSEKEESDRIDRIFQNGIPSASLIESSFLVIFCLQSSPCIPGQIEQKAAGSSIRDRTQIPRIGESENEDQTNLTEFFRYVEQREFLTRSITPREENDKLTINKLVVCFLQDIVCRFGCDQLA